MTHELWQTERNGIRTTEVGRFRLIVKVPKEVGGMVQFLMLGRRTGGSPDALLGSGNKENVRAAMEAAEQMAERCSVSLGKVSG
jgi:hypothetical protein